MFDLFGKKKEEKTVVPQDEFGGIGEVLADRVLEAFGISREQFEKVKTIIDIIDIDKDENDDVMEIRIKMKQVTIKVEK